MDLGLLFDTDLLGLILPKDIWRDDRESIQAKSPREGVSALRFWGHVSRSPHLLVRVINSISETCKQAGSQSVWHQTPFRINPLGVLAKDSSHLAREGLHNWLIFGILDRIALPVLKSKTL